MDTMQNTNDQTGSEDLEEKQILKKKLATEFPLSGGETDAEWFAITEDTPEEKKVFKRKLDTEFPLSGGEA